jgi:hypothetical protein
MDACLGSILGFCSQASKAAYQALHKAAMGGMGGLVTQLADDLSQAHITDASTLCEHPVWQQVGTPFCNNPL